MKFLRDNLIWPLFILLGILGSIGAMVVSVPLALYMKLTKKPSQHELFEEVFHRAISLIEMHKIRFGDYPENLSKPGIIQYLVADDLKVIQSISYQKLESGYELNVGTEELVRILLPDSFWQGLGVAKTNVASFSTQESTSL